MNGFEPDGKNRPSNPRPQQQPQPPHSASATSALSALALDDDRDDFGVDDFDRANGEQQQRPPSTSGAAPAAAPATAATGSAQGLDLTGAAISASAPAVGDLSCSSSAAERAEREAPAIVLPHQRGERVGHIALDIGGSLIKLVYFSPAAGGGSSAVEGQGGEREQQQGAGERPRSAAGEKAAAASPTAAAAAGEKAASSSKSSPSRPRPPRGGKLHFVKFETSKIDECLDFIEAKGLHRPQQGMGGFYYGSSERRSGAGGSGGSVGDGSKNDPPTRVRVLATGGGAYRFADLFRSRLGVILEKEDEMDCLVAGADFLLRAVRHEAFTFLDGTVRYHKSRNSAASASDSTVEGSSSSSSDDPYPYLLVNIGSGVSMVRVDGPGDHEHARVSGSSLGGGTFWGLCRLLTGARSFDEMLELSSRGDNTKVDMLVGDIYGKERDYSAIGLAASTIASSFGKAAAADLDLEAYDRADIAMALCRMVSYNIGHLAYLNAKRYGLSRVFFGEKVLLLSLFLFLRGSRSARKKERKGRRTHAFSLFKKKKLRRLLHPRAPLHDGNDQLRHPLLVPRRDGGELPAARGLSGCRRGLSEGAPAALARRRRRRSLLLFELCCFQRSCSCF